MSNAFNQFELGDMKLRFEIGRKELRSAESSVGFFRRRKNASLERTVAERSDE